MVTAFLVGFLTGFIVQAILVLFFGIVLRPYSWVMKLEQKLRRSDSFAGDMWRIIREKAATGLFQSSRRTPHH